MLLPYSPRGESKGQAPPYGGGQSAVPMTIGGSTLIITFFKVQRCGAARAVLHHGRWIFLVFKTSKPPHFGQTCRLGVWPALGVSEAFSLKKPEYPYYQMKIQQ